MRELGSARRTSLEHAILDDSCGCAMGARFMIVALLIAAPVYGWRYHVHVLGAWSAVWRAFAWLFLATGVGKVLGLLLHHWFVRRVQRRLTAASHR